MVPEKIKKLFKKTGYTFKKTAFLEKYYHSNSDPRYRRSGDLNPLEQLFYKHLDDDFFFIQIGANNGQRYDPIHHLLVREKHLVKGIAIEPVMEYFEELKVTYEDFPGIKLIKAAIHNTEKEMLIYKMNPAVDNMQERLKGMSSFDIFNFTKEGIPSNQIFTEKIPCISFMDLIEMEKISKLHLLQIDTEGYDLEIMNYLDFQKIRPMIINFEHRWQYNLVKDAELFKVLRSLIDNGYRIMLDGNDALAFID